MTKSEEVLKIIEDCGSAFVENILQKYKQRYTIMADAYGIKYVIDRGHEVDPERIIKALRLVDAAVACNYSYEEALDFFAKI